MCSLSPQMVKYPLVLTFRRYQISIVSSSSSSSSESTSRSALSTPFISLVKPHNPDFDSIVTDSLSTDILPRDPGVNEYDVFFQEASLGIELHQHSSHKYSFVASKMSSGTENMDRIVLNSILVGINQRRCKGSEHALQMLDRATRPVRMRFRLPNNLTNTSLSASLSAHQLSSNNTSDTAPSIHRSYSNPN